MNSKTRQKKITMFILVAFILLLAPIYAQAAVTVAPRAIAVLISQRIKPYIWVLKGLQQSLDKQNEFHVDVFFLSKRKLDAGDIQKNLLEKNYELFVSIGPEAGEFIWSMSELRHRKKIFSAILNPHNMNSMKNSPCGISLQIPVSTQIAKISEALPGIKTLGLLFDPKHNQIFFEKVRASGLNHGVKIVPFRVGKKTEIPRVFAKNLNDIDAVWMIPDPTVISEKIVQYVIKQALYQKKGVIGYNSYFIKSGAVFAFELDYFQIGIQTAHKANANLNDQACNATSPFFKTTINSKMMRHLGLTSGKEQE